MKVIENLYQKLQILKVCDPSVSSLEFKSDKIKKQKLVGLPQSLNFRFNPKTNRYVDFNNPNIDLYPFEKHLK